MNKTSKSIVGKVIHIKWTISPDKTVWKNVILPVYIIEDHKHFFRGVVLPHKNPSGFGLSNKYPLCINKCDVEKIIVVGDAENEEDAEIAS